MMEMFKFTTIEEKTSSRKLVLSYENFIKDNDRKGQYTLAHFRENCKKVKIEVTGPK